MLTLMQSFFLGFVITAVPGTVFIETVRRTLVDRRSVVVFLVGNVLGILLTVLSVLLGFALLTNDSLNMKVFYFLSGLFLLVIGVVSFRGRPNITQIRMKAGGRSKWFHAFLTGCLLALANPASVAFWVVMIGRFMSTDRHVYAILANVVAVNAGAIALYVILVSLIGKLKPFFTQLHLMWLSRIFGSLIMVYGLASLAKALTKT